MNSTPLKILEHEIQNLLADIQSDTARNRNKAVEQFNTILSNRKNEVVEIMKNTKNEFDLKWNVMFSSAIESLIKHSIKLEDSRADKSYQTMKNKNSVFSAMIKNIIDCASEAKIDFSMEVILERFFSSFTISSVTMNFGSLLLQILDDTLLQQCSNFSKVKISNFCRLISYLFDALESASLQLSYQIIKYLNRIIDIGGKYLQISYKLYDFVPNVINLSKNLSYEDRHKNELIKLIFVFVKEIAVDFHQSARTLFQNILPNILPFYQFYMKSDIKETFFELCNLAIVLHYPNMTMSSSSPNELNTIIRSMFIIVKNEIQKNSNVKNEKFVFSKNFIELATRLSYLIYWKNVFQDRLEDGPSKSKIIKTSEKLDAIIDHMTENFESTGWTWFSVLNKLLLINYCDIESSELIQIVNFISKCAFNKIKFSYQLEILREFCEIFAYHENDKNSNQINHKFWEKIWNLSSNTDNITTNQQKDIQYLIKKNLLLQILLKHKNISCTNETNILSLIHCITSKPIINQIILETLKIILMYHNKILHKSSNSGVIVEIIKWLYKDTCEKLTLDSCNTESSVIIDENIDIIAEISVLLTLKIKFKDTKTLPFQLNDFETIQKNLSFKYLNKAPIIEQRKNNKDLKSNYTPVLISFAENNFQLLSKAIELDLQISKNGNLDNNNDLFMSNVVKLERALNLLKHFKKFYLDNFDNFFKTFFKNIALIFNTISMQIEKITITGFNLADLQNLMRKFQIIFEIYNNYGIGHNIIEINISSIILFLKKFTAKDKLLAYFYNVKEVQKLVDNSLITIATYDYGQIKGGKQPSQYIRKYYDSNDIENEAHTQLFFTICKIYCNATPNQIIAEWIIDKLEEICKRHHNNKTISELIISHLPDIFKYITVNNPELISDIFVILSSFLKKCHNNEYSIEFTQKTLLIVKDFIKIYPNILKYDDFTKVSRNITKFLTSNSFQIQLSAVESFTYLIDSNWAFDNEIIPLEYFEYCKTLYENVQFNSNKISSKEHLINYNSIKIQYLISVFIVCPTLRHKCFLNLIEFCLINPSILDNRNFFEILHPLITDDFVELMMHYIIEKDHPLEELPWALYCDNENTFYKTKFPILTLFFLHSSSNIKIIKAKSKIETVKIIETTIPIYNAFISPFQINVKNAKYSSLVTSIMKNVNAMDINSDFFKKITENYIWKTLFYLFQYYWDEIQFKNYFGFDLKHNDDRIVTLNFTSLKECIENFLKNNLTYKEATFQNLLKMNTIQIIKTSAELKVQFENFTTLEMKLVQISRYFCLIEFILESLTKEFDTNTNLKKIRNYFIKDVLCFCGNVLINKHEYFSIKIAFLHYLKKFCSKVITRNHSEVLGKYVKTLIRQILNLIDNTSKQKLRTYCIDLLNFLIIDSQQYFNEFLGDLDEFPLHEDFQKFNDIREKYRKQIVTDNLEDNLKKFVNHSDRNWEEFRFLKNKISKLKSDLNVLCNKITINTEDHLLHQTINVLLDAIRSNEKENIVIEASKCLGEIGPIDLQAIAVNYNTDTILYKKTPNFSSSIKCFINCAAKSLSSLIFSSNQSICSLANDVCYVIANTETDFKILDEYECLYPFALNKNKKDIYVEENKGNLDLIHFLKETENFIYNEWIKKFTSNIYKYFKWDCFETLSLVDVSFCEATFVSLIKILTMDYPSEINNLENTVNYFFQNTSKLLDENSSNATIYKNKSIIGLFLDVAECIRTLKQATIQPLQLDCLVIAKACAYCEANFMAILYLELWAEQEKIIKKEKCSEIINDSTFQKVATQCYKSIGVTDAIEGFLNPIESRMDYLITQNRWTDVLLEQDIHHSNTVDWSQINQQMKDNGLFTLASKVENDNDYEICWRLSQWDKPTDIETNNTEFDEFNLVSDSNIEFYHFQALKSITEKKKDLVLDSISKGRKYIVRILKNISTECTQTIYKYCLWLQLFQQIEDFSHIQFLTNDLTVDELLEKWNKQGEIKYGNMAHKEISIVQRICLIQNAGIRADRKIKESNKGRDIIGEYMLNAIAACKEAGKQNLAIRHITNLRQMEEVSMEVKTNALIEDAKMNWDRSNTTLSIKILHYITTDKKFATCTNKINAMRIYGEYLAKTNSENFETIHTTIFDSALVLLDRFENRRNDLLKFPATSNSRNLLEFDTFSINCKREIHHSIAKYADREYVELMTRKNSEAFKRKVKLMEKNKQIVDSTNNNQFCDKDKAITINFISRNIKCDIGEIEQIEAQREQYLHLAVKNYIECCNLEDSVKTPSLYRILSLWFSNESDTSLTNIIDSCISQIPTYKFICVLDQIIARLGTSSNVDFSNIINKLLINCAKDHPHHTLPKLLAVKNVDADGNNKFSQNDARCVAATQILEQITKDNFCKEITQQLQKVCIALIDFSSTDLGKKSLNLKISDDLKKLQNLNQVHCLTLDLPISVNKDYSNIKYIIKWKNQVSLCGGVNAPKKLDCLCSDGISRPQLLKGRDDLRQDAILMQALETCNDLFKANKRNDLRLRTYKVVPLSKRSGILEWCENTIPLGVYLCGKDNKSGAHAKYYPEDYSVSYCRELMKKVSNCKIEEKMRTFIDICHHLHPVFHYFFYENFITPGLWFSRRLSYINSVASTSIVGYVLGLGDRHINNILVDEKTAELIHIDFGIAFEQGKIMPTPENVPFRLTRDILAPMGVCEYNGIFSKCCEQVMTILRKNQTILLTILEVLLYDPIYVWVLNSNNQELDPDTNNVDKNATAERALLRVKAKLDGMEEVRLGTTSVDIQVKNLINQATSLENLCSLFCGWSAYL